MNHIPYLVLFIVLISIGGESAYALVIGDNSTGGECNSVGMWNVTSRTCTLLGNVTDSVVLDANLITLNGNNFSLIGPGGDFENYGILSEVMFGITIKNIVVDDFYVGIQLRDSFNNTITNNTIQNIRFEGIDLESFSENNLILNNTVINNGGSGINLQSSNNTIQNNFAHGNKVGISAFSSNNIFTKNDVQLNTDYGFSVQTNDLIFQDNIISENLKVGIFDLGGNNLTISNNIISNNNGRGILLSSGNSNVYLNNFTGNSSFGLENGHVTNKIYNNNFLGNAINAKDSSGSAFFNLEEPTGGNYWDDFSNICSNTDNDNFCDDPYPFSGGTINVHDDLVWVIVDGWLTKFNGTDNIIVNATSENGAIVNYSVSASKNEESIPVSCDPLSGFLFPVGNSTVVCTAQTGVISEFNVTVNPFNVVMCSPPLSGDWIITSSCVLSTNASINGNVIVQNNAVLEISNGTILDIDFANFNLTVNSGSGVLIKSGGVIT